MSEKLPATAEQQQRILDTAGFIRNVFRRTRNSNISARLTLQQGHYCHEIAGGGHSAAVTGQKFVVNPGYRAKLVKYTEETQHISDTTYKGFQVHDTVDYDIRDLSEYPHRPRFNGGHPMTQQDAIEIFDSLAGEVEEYVQQGNYSRVKQSN